MTRRFWQAFDVTLHAVIGILVLALATIGVLQVFFRYVIESSLAWTEELSRVLLIWLVLLAAAAEIKRGTHIAMRLVVERMTPRWATAVERMNLLLIFCFAVILAIYGLELSERTMAQSATTLPLQMGQIYLALPLAGVIMAINALRVLWDGYRTAGPQPAMADVV